MDTDIDLKSRTTFKPQNFPADANPHIPAAGERTIYLNESMNDPLGNGFMVKKSVDVINGNVSQLEAGTLIYWSKPGRVFTSYELGIGGISNHALFSLQSPYPWDSDGIIPISAVYKPRRDLHRTVASKRGQEQVYNHLVHTYRNHFTTIEQLSIAKVGSRSADLVVRFDDMTSQFEIKNCSVRSAPITLFDKTVRRSKPHPTIDDLIKMVLGDNGACLSSYIDSLRQCDQTIGYPGDEGVLVKSGRFSSLKITPEHHRAHQIHEAILEHFAERGDNYFVVNYGQSNIKMFYTGFGQNILNQPSFPLPKYFMMGTYGGPSSGGMRVGAKIQLEW